MGKRQAAKAEQARAAAAQAFDRGRWLDAWRSLKEVADAAPAVADVRELAGLTLYRLGRWKAAVDHLEAYRSLSGSADRNPVLADCYRALGRPKRVDPLWEELREASAGPDIMVEGRIVTAGARADRGQVASAIALLEAGPIHPRGATKAHHLRLWYALADLYERAGDTARARDLFARIVEADPGVADAVERLEALG